MTVQYNGTFMLWRHMYQFEYEFVQLRRLQYNCL